MIKEDIKLIKSHIFDRGLNTSAFVQSNAKQSEKQQTQESAQEDEPYFGAKQRMKSQSSEHDSKVF